MIPCPSLLSPNNFQGCFLKKPFSTSFLWELECKQPLNMRHLLSHSSNELRKKTCSRCLKSYFTLSEDCLWAVLKDNKSKMGKKGKALQKALLLRPPLPKVSWFPLLCKGALLASKWWQRKFPGCFSPLWIACHMNVNQFKWCDSFHCLLKMSTSGH